MVCLIWILKLNSDADCLGKEKYDVRQYLIMMLPSYKNIDDKKVFNYEHEK